MLSRPSASSASCPHTRQLLRSRVSRPASARQARGLTGYTATQQKRNKTQQSPYTVVSQSSPHKIYFLRPTVPQWAPGQRAVSTAATSAEAPQPSEAERINALIERINANDDDMASLMHELDMMGDPEDMEGLRELVEFISQRDQHTPESWVHLVRQSFGETIPEGVLGESEMKLYITLYGEPIIQEIFEESMAEEEAQESDQLLRENEEGNWEEIRFEEEAGVEEDVPVVYDMEAAPEEEETIAMRRTREVAEQLGGEIMLEQFENEAVPDAAPRAHPLTMEGKFQTDPSTINLPKSTVTGPISIILSEFSNKHIAETARRLFGGPGLPHSTTTAPPRAQLPQLAIPINASQNFMGEMEANAFLAALYPGIYASTLSVLVEIRKRMGTEWIRGLISQEGGPNVLDASGGGAGILAWRDTIRAEWESMVPDHPEGDPIPYGRSTVLTAADTLRLRASAILDNTTFLPAPKRKQFDVIIAPHSLLNFDEEYERKHFVQNLWAMLNPNGGILILLEKGRQKGFEAIASAQSPEDGITTIKEPGMIIAPCTNHSTCPMHNTSGPTKGRRDYCHFEQRYIRPDFLQRIMGAKDRNHEDLKFSYLAVQRGKDMRQERGIRQDAEATDAAFEGFEHRSGSLPDVQPLALPRAVYPPMKRRGHVIFDLCTPAGKIERWTVPRSYSRQAYRDARKSRWGDLWALGAKTRVPRNLNLGDKHGEGKKERLARRAADKAAAREADEEGDMDEHARDDEEEEDIESANGRRDRSALPEIPMRKKGQNIPSWKKHADKKRIRLAVRKQSAADL
ncbi:uncharacterized protein N7477_000605 [Penicillium maclennaniae]|uniref:uncharacterized protein n=1 Tax=Penicillium maclennaniae TaxID=1343394 RepID=UPI00253FCF0B|nr:uncharacterized protein N7477_000605 [Penicillium maclennaniae]KAJ5684260.1 hypothetical protein N7477_000605 [Penicillium maclennaniae]